MQRTTYPDPDAYLAALDPERRAQLERLRELIKRAVPAASESMQSGLIGYAIAGRPFAALAAHKTTLSLYLMDLYTQPGLRAQHAEALATLKMGKSCINFKRADELPLTTIEAILKVAPTAQVSGGTLAAPAPAARAKRPGRG